MHFTHTDTMPEEHTAHVDLSEFRDTLKRKREQAGLKIAAAAKLAGVSPHTWTAVERGYDSNGKVRGASWDFVTKAVRGLGDWSYEEAFELAGLDPATVPPDDEPVTPRRFVDLFNSLSKRRQQAVVWIMELMKEEHAAMPGAPAAVADKANPVFITPPDTDRRTVRRT